jgi:uncharacterized tellurite resistance protein B-like protein
MSHNSREHWFDQTNEIVSDTLRFKARLRIGSDAYATNRFLNMASDLWASAGTGGAVAIAVKSAPVASTFFAPTGFLAALGIGTAVTPIGWVAASAALAGAGWYGALRYLKRRSESRSTSIPDFINSPVDVLGLALFDLMAPIALKLAEADGDIDENERKTVEAYFIDQWGFNADFVREGLEFTESQLVDFSIDELAVALAKLKRKSKDCNYREMTREFIDFMREIAEADGRLDHSEEMAIANVQSIFLQAEQSRPKKKLKVLAEALVRNKPSVKKSS